MKNQTRAILLLADNDADYRRTLRRLLELEDYQVEEAASPQEAVEKLGQLKVDLALLDLRMANHDDAYDISGLEVAKKAMEMDTHCIILTAYPSEETMRMALRSRGAEPLACDYVYKKSGPQAVLDTIQAVLRGSRKEEQPPFSDLMIDLERGLVSYKGEPVNLSRQQYALLAYLHRKDGAVCSPEELIKAIYDEDVSAERASADKRLERLVERLREKIEEDPSEPRRLLKVFGRGYRLAVNY
ncbi:Transcriptional regulatory protein SrrA [Anaerolineae bacterium]|nr:Transcriptional regulatory protein SrrA [Anaerolineae bacterium]